MVLAEDYKDFFFSGLLGKLLVAVVILLGGFVIGRLVGRVIQKLLHEVELDKTLSNANLNLPLEQTIASIVSYMIYFISIIMALNQVGLTTYVLYMIMGGAVVLILIATALGIKDFIPNIIAGLVIYRRRFFKIGDNIKVNNIEGKIIALTIIETVLETKKGDAIHIPNSSIVKSGFTVKS